MPRQARIVSPGYPHHVIQRGNRRMTVFFKPNDYALYLDLLKEWSAHYGLSIWAYCLMPNHVHIIAEPHESDMLSLTFSQVHKRYTQFINKREGWTGHLWQGRFSSHVMDESHALCAARYIENNPVAAGICSSAAEYRWSSAAFHLGLTRDPLIKPDHPLRSLVRNWNDFLKTAETPHMLEMLQQR